MHCIASSLLSNPLERMIATYAHKISNCSQNCYYTSSPNLLFVNLKFEEKGKTQILFGYAISLVTHDAASSLGGLHFENRSGETLPPRQSPFQWLRRATS
jgi:hypothetical protein